MRTERNWFPTYSGIKFYPTDPTVDAICIEDIAHSLSLQCRFAGHVRWFYSVAQHSVIVSQNLPPELRLAGLLHDAAEAYCQDLIRPIKAHLAEYLQICARIEDVICQKYDVYGMYDLRVKEADLRALVTERRDLYRPSPADDFNWGVNALPYERKIDTWSPDAAESIFLERFKELSK